MLKILRKRKLKLQIKFKRFRERETKRIIKKRKIKDQIKQLETLYVNEIQLTLGEEFKFDSPKKIKKI